MFDDYPMIILWLRSAIGGKKEYAKIEDETAMVDAKLFVCSNASGKPDYHTNATNPQFVLLRIIINPNELFVFIIMYWAYTEMGEM